MPDRVRHDGRTLDSQATKSTKEFSLLKFLKALFKVPASGISNEFDRIFLMIYVDPPFKMINLLN